MEYTNVPDGTNTNIPSSSGHSLEEVVGVANMDQVIKSAVAVWDNFVGKYPDSLLNKSFIFNNIKLVRRMLDVVVPAVMRKNLELEQEIEHLSGAYNISHHKRLQEIVALSTVIPVTASVIDTLEQLDAVADQLFEYGITVSCLDIGSNDADITSESELKLTKPMWLLCAILPNETLSPHLLDHDTYCSVVSNINNIKTVELAKSPLMDASDEVEQLLNELDF